MLALSGDFCDGGMRAKIDYPTCRRIACGAVAFTGYRFQSAPSSNLIVVADSGGTGEDRTAADSGFVATGEQRPPGDLLDHGV
jgi:hypothetical protein